MNPFQLFRQVIVASLLSLAASGAIAQVTPSAREGEFHIGQPGKDVIWLPAELVMVDKMLDIAAVTPADTVVDLGSGDGRTVIAAAKRGARGIGVELDPALLTHSRRTAEREGVAARASFVQQDLFEFDLSRASVITLFLLDEINLRLRPKLLGLAPGTRVVSNTFTMGDWKHEAEVHDDTRVPCVFNCTAYLWVIPAKAEGVWQVPEGMLTLKQHYQMLSGTLRTGAGALSVTGRLRGEELRLSSDGVEIKGRVRGDAIEGAVETAGTRRAWSAKRIAG